MKLGEEPSPPPPPPAPRFGKGVRVQDDACTLKKAYTLAQSDLVMAGPWRLRRGKACSAKLEPRIGRSCSASDTFNSKRLLGTPEICKRFTLQRFLNAIGLGLKHGLKGSKLLQMQSEHASSTTCLQHVASFSSSAPASNKYQSCICELTVTASVACDIICMLHQFPSTSMAPSAQPGSLLVVLVADRPLGTGVAAKLY